MKFIGSLIVCFLVNTFFAGPIITGNSIVESGKVIPNQITVKEEKSLLEREMLQNPGFETGLLSPWTTNNWIVDTINPHKGRFCASTVGNNWIRQDIIPIHASRINHISFWARQPEAPAAQAYDFIYYDSTVEEFVHYPTADWAQYDVTPNLNRQKILVAFRLWGYSGGGPNPDSTYIDDVSIFRYLDVEIRTVYAPRDTFYMGDTISPRIRVKNNDSFSESLWVWCRIEHTCSTHIYRDSSLIRDLGPGLEVIVDFESWTPRYLGLHRYMFAFDPNDTTWHYFWVIERSGVKENDNFSLKGNNIKVRPSIGRSFEFVCIGEHKLPDALKIYNSTGKLVWSKKISAKEPVTIKWYGTNQLGRGLSPGVYLLRYGDITKQVILTN